MATEQHSINIADIPTPLQEIAREVSRTRHRQRLPVDGEDVTIIVEPLRPRRSPSKARPVTKDDPLMELIGIGRSGRPSNASENKHEALAEAYQKLHHS
jgi:hypothetical protein